MTLTPLIVAVCLNSGSTYNVACKTSLEQGATQSGLSGHFEKLTSRVEKDAIKYIDPSAEAEVVVSVIGYSVQLLSGNQANFSIPNPGLKNSSLSLGIGRNEGSVNLLINF